MQFRDGHGKTNLIAFSFCLFALSLYQTNASLLDSTLIGNELRKFARDALCADEMQVRNVHFFLFLYDMQVSQTSARPLTLKTSRKTCNY